MYKLINLLNFKNSSTFNILTTNLVNNQYNTPRIIYVENCAREIEIRTELKNETFALFFVNILAPS